MHAQSKEAKNVQGEVHRRAWRRPRVGAHHAHDGGARRHHLGARRPSASQRLRTSDRPRDRVLRDDRGSASAEFVFVGALLTLLTLSVLQLGLIMHVRNTVLDAASEGARFASLAGNSLTDGATRTGDLITTAVGPQFAQDISVREQPCAGRLCAVVIVRAPLPVFGFATTESRLEVTGRAAIEDLG